MVYKFHGGQSSGTNKSCFDLNTALCMLLRPEHQIISAGWLTGGGGVDIRQCGHLMLPGPGQGDQSPQCRVAQHTAQFARSSTCPVQWGSLH